MRYVKLTDICNITTGKLDSNAAEKNGKYPYFTCAPEPLKINTYAFDDDVILLAGNNASGNFHCQRFNGKFNAYQRTYIITAKSGYDIDYIFYNLMINLTHLKKIAQGSQTKFLTLQILNTFKVKDLDITEQRRFSSILSNIDKKISLNNKIISELESMAKTIYDYWFLQFEFPNDEGKPYKSSGGKMVWNEELKREIPEGWEATRVDDIVKQPPKIKSIKAPDYLEKGQYPIVDQAETLITGYTNDSSLIYENTNGCVVFGDVTTYFKYINFPFAKGTDGTKILESKNNRIPSLLLFFLVKDAKLPNIGFARHYMYLRDFKFVLPPIHVCNMFKKCTESIMLYRSRLISENQELTSLRDFLLPLLMNGQVGFKDEEK
ncbi:restriction endonuclease subunit S [Faecalitalea cylindroides]|uniref:restriction endonuclease subunit S n=1 Tax=Faecalitalea cylindroides TaxID=39483 RepID=UPI0024916EF8|nr:restriction endonuclease subunit S [Faecalitalea cylindroides]